MILTIRRLYLVLFAISNCCSAGKIRVEDEAVVRKSVAAICTVYGELLRKVPVKNAMNKALINNITALYAKISELPIVELLALLDTISTQIVEILNSYEQNAGTTFQQWIYKFWWIPPTIIGSIIIKILLHRIGIPEIPL
jgi:hypothetical protein